MFKWGTSRRVCFRQSVYLITCTTRQTFFVSTRAGSGSACQQPVAAGRHLSESTPARLWLHVHLFFLNKTKQNKKTNSKKVRAQSFIAHGNPVSACQYIHTRAHTIFFKKARCKTVRGPRSRQKKGNSGLRCLHDTRSYIPSGP